MLKLIIGKELMIERVYQEAVLYTHTHTSLTSNTSLP